MLDVGVISEGTLKSEDMLRNLADALEPVAEYDADSFTDERSTVRHARNIADHVDAFDKSEIDDVIFELYNALDNHAPMYCHVGAHDGDGACIGVFPNIERVQDAAQDGEVLTVDDLGEVDPAEAVQYEAVAVVNDHGNMSLYVADGDGFTLQWAVV